METTNISVPTQFFKVMMPGFHHKLSLPPAVSKEVEKLNSRKAFLESRLGRWRVNLCASKNGVICLEQGWPQFVERHALTVGQFVVFEHTGDLRFNVTVFKTNFCENMFLDNEEEETLILANKTTIVAEEEEEEEEEGMSFEKRMVPSYATMYAIVNIPLKFMRRNNIGVQCRKVVLIDPIGREWDVKLAGKSNDGLRCRMRTGWRGFYASNGLNDGDICVFRLNRDLVTSTSAVFNVKIVRAR